MPKRPFPIATPEALDIINQNKESLNAKAAIPDRDSVPSKAYCRNDLRTRFLG